MLSNWNSLGVDNGGGLYTSRQDSFKTWKPKAV